MLQLHYITLGNEFTTWSSLYFFDWSSYMFALRDTELLMVVGLKCKIVSRVMLIILRYNLWLGWSGNCFSFKSFSNLQQHGCDAVCCVNSSQDGQFLPGTFFGYIYILWSLSMPSFVKANWPLFLNGLMHILKQTLVKHAKYLSPLGYCFQIVLRNHFCVFSLQYGSWPYLH